jgi:hypothetical protein
MIMKNHRGVPTGIVPYVGPGNVIIKTKMSNDMINARQKHYITGLRQKKKRKKRENET